MKYVLLIVLLSPLLLLIQSKKATKNQSPKIIYILADDLGYGDVKSFNPQGKIQTPNMDIIAENGGTTRKYP